MKIIIAGSRTITDKKEVFRLIGQTSFQISEVVCGQANGVDKIGAEWAKANGIPVANFPANWNLHGKKAGYLRNLEMGKYADGLILIWDGQSKGSASMLNIANKLHLPSESWVIGDSESHRLWRAKESLHGFANP